MSLLPPLSSPLPTCSAQCLEYLGSHFHIALGLPKSTPAAAVAAQLLADYVFIHLDPNRCVGMGVGGVCAWCGWVGVRGVGVGGWVGEGQGGDMAARALRGLGGQWGGRVSQHT